MGKFWKKIVVQAVSVSVLCASACAPESAIYSKAGAVSGGWTAEPSPTPAAVQDTAGKKKTDYSRYSTSKHGWGLSTNTSHVVPVNGEARGIKKKKAYYYVKTKKKRIYLTFDCGYENGHTARILDILKKKEVKAIFFVTEDYIRQCPKLVKRMKREGHMVGNHTVNHPSLPTCPVARMKRELKQCASFMKKTTGLEMDPYMRPPMGEWSHQSLKVTKDLGYATIFWSMAFYDYNVYQQPGKEAIYNQFMLHYHKGAIVLLHAISQSDTQALPSIIRDMKKLGYSFGTLDELFKKKKDEENEPEAGIGDGSGSWGSGHGSSTI